MRLPARTARFASSPSRMSRIWKGPGAELHASVAIRTRRRSAAAVAERVGSAGPGLTGDAAVERRCVSAGSLLLCLGGRIGRQWKERSNNGGHRNDANESFAPHRAGVLQEKRLPIYHRCAERFVISINDR